MEGSWLSDFMTLYSVRHSRAPVSVGNAPRIFHLRFTSSAKHGPVIWKSIDYEGQNEGDE